MIKTAFYLSYIYFRKFFVKGDFLALGILAGVTAAFLYTVYQSYSGYYGLLFLPLLATLFHHWERKDTSLLRQHTSLRKVIIFEYFIENSPFIIVFLLKTDFLMLLLFLAALVLIAFLPQTSGKTIPYPFLLVTPHWHTAFRKYKLLWTIPFLAAFLVIGYVYENENLALFSLGCTAFVGTLPYFERGHTAHIAASKYIGNHFLFREIKTAFLNFLMIFTPVFVLFLVFFEISYFWTLPLFFTLPLLGLLTQYSFYGSPLTQSVVLALLLAFSPYGLPIVVLPVFYFSSLRFIKKIQYADN